MTGTADLPDSFHVLWIHSQCFFIDDATRKEIEYFLTIATKPTEFITVDSLGGEEVMVIAYNVSNLFSMTPATRERDRALRKCLKDETPFGEEE